MVKYKYEIRPNSSLNANFDKLKFEIDELSFIFSGEVLKELTTDDLAEYYRKFAFSKRLLQEIEHKVRMYIPEGEVEYE